MFLPKSSNLSGSKTAELFSRVLFQLPGDTGKQIYCYVFFCALSVIGAREVHSGTQRFGKSTQICYGIIYPHSIFRH